MSFLGTFMKGGNVRKPSDLVSKAFDPSQKLGLFEEGDEKKKAEADKRKRMQATSQNKTLLTTASTDKKTLIGG